MAYTLAPFNPTSPYPQQVATELNTANNNFTILGQAFYNNDPTSQPILRATYTGSSAPSNPVAGTTWLDTSVNPPVLRVYDGSNWQSNIDTVDGFNASQTPAPNMIVPLNSSGILDLSATYVKSNVYTFRRVDLSNASSDYALQTGEEAIINFNNATNVPLNIATQSGTYYEMHVICSNTGSTSGGSANPIYLNPNNTTYSNAFYYVSYVRATNSSGNESSTFSAFKIGYSYAISSCYITNYTQYKGIRGLFDAYGGGAEYPYLVVFSTDWRDTSTAWSSIGTVSFPQTSSGYILVRRLA